MKAFFRTLPLLGMMACIFLLSQQPGDTLSLPSFAGADKIAHFLAYALLATTAIFSFSFFLQDRMKQKSIALLVVLFCVLYGISDEYHQSFVPFRDVSAADVLADGIGAVCAVLAWLFRGNAGSDQAK